MSGRYLYLSILAFFLGSGCGNDGLYKDYVEPALARGLDFGYVYKDLSPEHAGLVFHSVRSDNDVLPRHELTLRVSSMRKGEYTVEPFLQPSDFGPGSRIAEVHISTRYNLEDGSPRRVPLRILSGKVQILEDGPGLGVWSTDGANLGVKVDLIANRKRFGPQHCEGTSDKETKRTQVRCLCINALREEKTCDLDLSEEADPSKLEDLNIKCCDKLGLFPEENEALSFEHDASFGKDFCEDIHDAKAAHIYCYPKK